MMTFNETMTKRLRQAIRDFWTIRERQWETQRGSDVAARDRGARGAVTGGKQMDGFLRLVHDVLVEGGLSSATIYCRGHPGRGEKRPKKSRNNVPFGTSTPSCTQTDIPGWFRAEKDWDLLVITRKSLVAALEFKSQVGPSFGNNFQSAPREATAQPGSPALQDALVLAAPGGGRRSRHRGRDTDGTCNQQRRLEALTLNRDFGNY
jgi:hypothetical protein